MDVDSASFPQPWKKLYTLAQAGCVAEVNVLIMSAPACYAVAGYAVGGHAEEVRKLNANGFFNYQALYGYAFGGHTALVNEQVAAGALHAAAIEGYEKGGYLGDLATVLALLAFIDNEQLRHQLAETASKHFYFPNKEKEISKAGAVNTMMRTYELNYIEAQKMVTMSPQERVWLLQGWQAFNGEMPFFVFLELAAALLKCSTVTASKLFIAVNKEVYARSTQRVLSNFQSGLFGINACMVKQRELGDNYIKRTGGRDEMFGHQHKRQRR